ncbi:MAG: hypothetical protein M3Q23_13235 [Actinomycetota bacterium]|nr:hypothetical protein [Actinomycetota bacterium]
MVAVPDPVTGSDPVAVYHELLEDQSVLDDSLERLHEGQREHRLVFGEHPLCVSLRPQLVTRQRYDEAVAASNAVVSALGALERALLRDAGLRAELDLEPEEETLALAHPGCRHSSPSARIDGFFTDRLRYVEYNAESPAGIAYSDHLAEVFEAMPVMRAFRKRFRLRRLPVQHRQVSVMLRAFREWGRDRKPSVAIVDWKGLPTVSEFEMFRDRFAAEGVTAVICDPMELEYRRGRLYANGTGVNLVYRRVLTSELLAKGDEAGALARAYLDGAACVVNTFRAKLLHKKMSLALLSDEQYASLYSAAQRRAIERHVPWTRRVRTGPTTYRGRRIDDLADHVAKGRDELVLKPNDEYGGKGVVLGWTVDQHEWEQALEAALTQSYVVQEAVPVPREPFPVALDGVHYLDLATDMDPYVFEGRASGCLSRLSSSALLNVTAGEGSVVPTFVVEGPR